ncbi:ABC transporter ATP-binding protein [Alloscardovia omnicolens]|uniref:ABC transporter ATP-binding protein n=1 Tax=Alloscardovia omnicolens TaxID=419015 RepID=UPI003A626868
MSQAAISLRNLSVSMTGERTIDLVRNVNLDFYWGSINLLYGHSGCGKTSLLTCLTGLAQERSYMRVFGQIVMDGHDVSTFSPSHISQFVSCVLQNPDAQIIHGTVEDEIAFSCENLGLPPALIHTRVKNLCELFQLDSAADTATLSGGQKERLCIASALACDKKIIILDEPLAHLDSHSAHMVLDVLASLARQGYCIIICEHRVSTVSDYADRAFCMHNGSLSEVTPQELKSSSLDFVTSYEQIMDMEKPAPATDARVLLELTNIDVLSPDKRKRSLVHVDSLVLREREIVLLLGDNGAGKSTLLNVLAGVGRIKRPGRRTLAHRVMAGLVWQAPEYQMFSSTVAGEMALRTKDQELCERELDSLELSALKERHPLALSEGEKRRLVCAATCAAQPEILLMDEPFAGLDSANIHRQRERIATLVSEHNSCVVISTHDVRGILDMVTRVLYMRHGQIVSDIQF